MLNYLVKYVQSTNNRLSSNSVSLIFFTWRSDSNIVQSFKMLQPLRSWLNEISHCCRVDYSFLKCELLLSFRSEVVVPKSP